MASRVFQEKARHKINNTSRPRVTRILTLLRTACRGSRSEVWPGRLVAIDSIVAGRKGVECYQGGNQLCGAVYPPRWSSECCSSVRWLPRRRIQGNTQTSIRRVNI